MRRETERKTERDRWMTERETGRDRETKRETEREKKPTNILLEMLESNVQSLPLWLPLSQNPKEL